MGGAAGGKGKAISAINVTPFVDVVLVLLVVLMVTAIQVVRGAIPVELPTAASAGEAVESTLNVVISKEGDTYLDGEMVDEEKLIATVQREAKSNPKLQAVIAADKAVAYEVVIRVIDLVKQNGVSSFALNIERPSKD